MLFEIETCQIRGQDSQSSLYAGRRLTKNKQLPALIICGLKFGQECQKAAQKKEKEEWAIVKPKLDNARNLRGTYFIDPEDEECQETIKNARKKVETPLEAAMPCKMEKRSKELRGTVASGGTHPLKKTGMLVLLKLTNPQRGVWSLLFRAIRAITSRKNGLLFCVHKIWRSKRFPLRCIWRTSRVLEAQ